MVKENENDLLVVATYNDAFEAGLAQDRLRENDIVSYLEEENILGLNPEGGVEVKVRRKDFVEAKEILEEVMK